MLADLFGEYYAPEFDEAQEGERTANTLMGVAVQLPSTGCSIRDTNCSESRATGGH